jgi:DNA-binding transcriptional MerR regulator
MDQSAALVLCRTRSTLLTLEDLASGAGVHPGLVQAFVASGLLEPELDASGAALFAPSAVTRLRRIVRLRRDLGVNLAGVAVILEMRERIEALQLEVERLRKLVADLTRP